MDDEEYARELFRILTAPPETDLEPWHLGDDWIDRYDGFGTEVRVTSVEVVPGPYGAQVEVGFRLEVPQGLDVPEVGSVRLPVEEGWRVLSGFAEPEDYAPQVASRVTRSAREHVVARTRGPRRTFEVPEREEQHALLLQVLGRRGAVEQVTADRYVVRTGGSGDADDPVVVLTPDEWEQVLRRHGPPHDSFDHYEELFASTPVEHRFWVFWEGDLTSSTREQLPPVKAPQPPLREVRRRIARARASGAAYGWFAYDPRTDDQLPG